MRHGSLFSGIGGFDLAARKAGWENVFNCEIDEFCTKVLQFHFPNTTHHYDIKKTDFSIYRGKIDVLSGGFPCQPFSHAGKRKGVNDNRYLWPEMFRAVKEVQPEWVIAENVYGIITNSKGVVFETVLSDLENQGYETASFILPACSQDAPHRRDRVWIIAYTNRNGFDGGDCKNEIDTNSRGEYALSNSKSMDSLSSDAVIADSEGFSEMGREIRQTITGPDWKDNWGAWPIEPPFCYGANGVSPELLTIPFSDWRRRSIEALGNAIVPHVALQIFETINSYNNLNLRQWKK